MSQITLVTGGARSGKSTYALELARAVDGKRAFIATGVATDDEMVKRIRAHQDERKGEFDTVEASEYVKNVLDAIAYKYDVILIDCVTLLINNMMYRDMENGDIYDEFDRIIEVLGEQNVTAIFVTNEVGLGIVPNNPLARRFRDLQGRVNQKLASASSNVYMVVSGIAMKIK